MIKVLFFFLLLTLYGCNKSKTVMICGDHVCVNKAEAKQFFEDNLSLEVKIINKKEKKEINLVELNLKSNSEGEKKINIINKKKTNKKIVTLSKSEIEQKKAEIKEKIKSKNKNKKKIKQAKLDKKTKKKAEKNIEKITKTVNKRQKEVVDICTILKKCNIDEISKYLIKQGAEKKFPDITLKE